jgi:hypothetical protein
MSSHYAKQLVSSSPGGWSIVKATVTSCGRRFFSGGTVYNTGGPASPTTYIVTFEYQVENKRYRGKMGRGTPVALGHQFEISYDRSATSRNKGSDPEFTWKFRIVAWIIGAAVVGVIIYFQNR